MSSVKANEYSDLLSTEENLEVFKLLGNRCQSLCTTVVQLFCTNPPHHLEWIKKDTGILCFVKDNTRKSFFFRLFCLRKNIKLWEHELYKNMEYIASTSLFHMFESHDSIVAFNFASNEEAKNLHNIVNKKINARKKNKAKRSRINFDKQRLDFVSKSDFDEELKAFFKKAGVSEQQLQDKNTRKILYNFVSANGGRDAVVKSLTTNSCCNIAPPAIPPRSPSPLVGCEDPPPLPKKCSSTLVQNVKSKNMVPLEQPANLPLPPPIPPLLLLNNRVTTPIGTYSKQAVEDTNILHEDARLNLLSDIRKGFKLKSVEKSDVKTTSSSSSNKSGGTDLVFALKLVIAKRHTAIHSDDDETTSENENDWELP